MSRPARSIVVSVALAVLASLALSGCVAVRTAKSQATAVGQCTELSARQEIDAVSDTNPAVSCTGPHNMQVFAVTEVGDRWASRSSRPDLQILKGIQSELCGVPQLRGFVGAADRDSVTDLQIRAYFPTTSAWDAGSRKVSCAASVAGADSGPATIDYSLAGVMATTRSAALRTCYKQDAVAGGGWAQSAKAVSCEQRHSTQDLNAWLPLGDQASVSAESAQSTCLPYALQFFGTSALPPGLAVSGVVWQDSNGTHTLRCAIGGDSGHGDVTGAILASV